MTAFALPGDRDRFLASGMDDYVSKPVRQNELANLLRTISPLVLQAGMVVGGPEEKPKRAINPVKIEPAGPALDPDALAALQESLGDRYTAEFEEISAIFIEYATPLLAKLHEAVDHQDGEALFSNAHALKSSSGNIAALRLAGLCSELEALSRSSQLSGTSAKLAELELEFDRVKAALELKKTDT
jgi:HPt (histidine-containing phosphotransfer) domain-containing protein